MPSWFMFAAGNAPLISVGSLDIVIIAIYFVVVLGIGIYLKKFVSTGEDFFMAGRKMTAWIAGLSFISANLSSLETMGWSAMAYQYGMLGAHAYLIGAIPAILFLAIVMMPFYYICKTHSVPGYLKLRYGSSSALAGISFALLTVLVSGASMFGMAKILHLLLGWNMNVSIWVASLTVAVYVTLGGLISAVFNEVLQYFLIWFGSLLIPVLGLIDAGGWNGTLEKIRHNVPVIHPSVGSANFTSLWRNLGSFDTNPMGIDWFGMVFGLGLAVSFGYWCTDFLQVQRVIVAKDLRSAQNGTIIGAVLKMLVPIIVTIPGLLGLAVLLNTDGSPLVLVPESDPRANITHHTFNDVLPMTIARETTLPPRVEQQGSSAVGRLLAPDVVLAGSNQPDKFGLEGVPVVLLPGVKVKGVEVQQTFNPAEFNPAHTKCIARSEKAKPMAVNMYSAFWTLIICVSVLIGVSLFTEPKPEKELHNLVMGLTPLPDDGPVPWYKHPCVWATVVVVVLAAINVIFW